MKRKTLKQSTKETIIFFIVTYGVCWGVGILNYIYKFMSGNTMGLFMMMLPATGVSVAKIYKKYKNDRLKRIHLTYIISVSIFFALLFLRVFGVISKNGLEVFSEIIVRFVPSFLVVIFSWLDGEEVNPPGSWKKARGTILIYVFASIIMGVLNSLDKKPVNALMIANLLLMPVLFFLQAATFFGEEYGWRGFLQDKMQRKFGKRLGVILLGVIWECWHMPLWFDLYKVSSLDLLFRFISTTAIAVVIGYAYMVSKNIWVCAFLHFCNNAIVTAFADPKDPYVINSESNTVFSIIGITLFAIICFSFLFRKAYRKEAW